MQAVDEERCPAFYCSTLAHSNKTYEQTYYLCFNCVYSYLYIYLSSKMQCSSCGSHDIDFNESAGHAVCVVCGTVLEENTIVSSIEFQEAGDRSQIVGQFVSGNCSQVWVLFWRGCYLLDFLSYFPAFSY